ncbi:hypothetical protein CYMTET_39688 [Cymbomonas tetramitiformis]|uniref:DAGKc domain-containing protein n=1 Tax=Cymbomonas tetramitiformis TaxID=36881 RepID=A0AAE0F5D2_9CHLO|nr:hypothetical protein CYMTET_39688 [Cymbomonas tetramitiformis]
MDIPPTLDASISTAHTVKSVLLLVNPISGKGDTRSKRKNLVRFIECCAANGITVTRVDTSRANHCYETLLTYPLELVDCVCVAGGDGTYRESVAGMLARTDKLVVPITVLPLGSGNNLARDCGINSYKDTLAKLREGRRKRVDALQVAHRDGTDVSVNVVTWGIGLAVGKTAETRLRWLGPLKYDVATLWHILWNLKRRARLFPRVDGKGNQVDMDFHLMLAQNTRRMGNGYLSCPSSQLDDGKMDLAVIPHLPRLSMLKLFMQLKGDGAHVLDKRVQYIQVDQLNLETEESEEVNIDGDRMVWTPITIDVLPNSWEVLV